MARTVKGTIVPHTSVIRKLGKRTRAMPYVVTELVDNSVDSWLDMPNQFKRGKSLTVQIDPSTHYFIVRDNAGGMTQDELFKAMRVAHSEKTDRIGSYGFGLKSAAMYIGNRFEIFTIHYSQPKKVLKFEFDAEAFEKRARGLKADDDMAKAWEAEISILSAQEVAEDGISFPDGHGTIIRIDNERYKSALKEGIKNRLRRTFAPMLEIDEAAPILRAKAKDVTPQYSKMRLHFDGEELEAAGIFYEAYMPRPKGAEVEDQKERTKGAQDKAALDPTRLGELVYIKETKLPSKRTYSARAGLADRFLGHSGDFGFDIIKRGRVIEFSVNGDEVGVPTQTRYGKVVGQLFLDEFPTDHQKISFLRDEVGDDWNLIGARVKQEIVKLLRLSAGLAEKSRGPSKPVDESLVKDTQASLQRASRTSEVKEALTKEERPQTRFKTETKKEKPLTVTQMMQTKSIIEFSNEGGREDLAKGRQKVEKNYPVVTCTVNTDHPFIKNVDQKQLGVLSKFLGADLLAELFVKNQSNVEDRLGEFLKIRAAIIRGFKE